MWSLWIRYRQHINFLDSVTDPSRIRPQGINCAKPICFAVARLKVGGWWINAAGTSPEIWTLIKNSWEPSKQDASWLLATLGHNVGHQDWSVCLNQRSYTDKIKPQIALCCNELQFRLERCSQLHTHIWPVTHLSACNWPCLLVVSRKEQQGTWTVDSHYILFLSFLDCMYVLFVFIFLLVPVNIFYLISTQ